tara:strand:+ start:317 stop:604 length:288 start_codon:yes stop_codon:yes gene_type:complete
MGSLLKKFKAVGENIGEKLGALSAEETKKRLDICEACEHFKIDVLGKDFARCDVCGCFMQVKAKFAGLSCPIGKWGKREESKNKPLWNKATKDRE